MQHRDDAYIQEVPGHKRNVAIAVAGSGFKQTVCNDITICLGTLKYPRDNIYKRCVFSNGFAVQRLANQKLYKRESLN